jgi:hypothetical protein
MKVSAERVANGFIVRDESTDEVIVVAEDTEVRASQQMLIEVMSRLGQTNDSWEAETLRVIVLPGRKWIPARRGGCSHPWIERWQIRDEPPHWWCPCGAEFTQLTEGGSFEADSEEPRDPPAAKQDPAEEAPPNPLVRWRAQMLAAGRVPGWVSLMERICECPLVSGTHGLTARGVAELSADGHEDYCPAKLADDDYEAIRVEIFVAGAKGWA